MYTGRPTRLDRHDAYVWIHVGLWFLALGILLAPAPNTVLSTLSWDTQRMLGVCLLVGSSLALFGVLLGGRIPFTKWRLAGQITRHEFHRELGDDIRAPYTFSWLGLISVGASMLVYAYAISLYSDIVGTLGGALTFALAGMCITLGARFFARVHGYNKRRDELITTAKARIHLKAELDELAAEAEEPR